MAVAALRSASAVMSRSEGTAPTPALSHLISALANTLVEVRTRALKNIVSKLESGILVPSDLVHEDLLLVNLLEWFNFPEVPMQLQTLSLVHTLAEASPFTRRRLVDVGAVEFLDAFRIDAPAYLASHVEALLDLLHAVPPDVPPHLRGIAEAADIAARASSASLNPPQGDHGTGFRMDRPTPATPATAEPSDQPPRQPLPVLPRLRLGRGDDQVLTEVGVRLRLADAAPVERTLWAMATTHLHSFPPQVFYQQHVSVLRTLVALLRTTERSVEDMALFCLGEWIERLAAATRGNRSALLSPDMYEVVEAGNDGTDGAGDAAAARVAAREQAEAREFLTLSQACILVVRGLTPLLKDSRRAGRAAAAIILLLPVYGAALLTDAETLVALGTGASPGPVREALFRAVRSAIDLELASLQDDSKANATNDANANADHVQSSLSNTKLLLVLAVAGLNDADANIAEIAAASLEAIATSGHARTTAILAALTPCYQMHLETPSVSKLISGALNAVEPLLSRRDQLAFLARFLNHRQRRLRQWAASKIRELLSNRDGADAPANRSDPLLFVVTDDPFGDLIAAAVSVTPRPAGPAAAEFTPHDIRTLMRTLRTSGDTDERAAAAAGLAPLLLDQRLADVAIDLGALEFFIRSLESAPAAVAAPVVRCIHALAVNSVAIRGTVRRHPLALETLLGLVFIRDKVTRIAVNYLVAVAAFVPCPMVDLSIGDGADEAGTNEPFVMEPTASYYAFPFPVDPVRPVIEAGRDSAAGEAGEEAAAGTAASPPANPATADDWYAAFHTTLSVVPATAAETDRLVSTLGALAAHAKHHRLSYDQAAFLIGVCNGPLLRVLVSVPVPDEGALHGFAVEAADTAAYTLAASLLRFYVAVVDRAVLTLTGQAAPGGRLEVPPEAQFLALVNNEDLVDALVARFVALSAKAHPGLATEAARVIQHLTTVQGFAPAAHARVQWLVSELIAAAANAPGSTGKAPSFGGSGLAEAALCAAVALSAASEQALLGAGDVDPVRGLLEHPSPAVAAAAWALVANEILDDETRRRLCRPAFDSVPGRGGAGSEAALRARAFDLVLDRTAPYLVRTEALRSFVHLLLVTLGSDAVVSSENEDQPGCLAALHRDDVVAELPDLLREPLAPPAFLRSVANLFALAAEVTPEDVEGIIIQHSLWGSVVAATKDRFYVSRLDAALAAVGGGRCNGGGGGGGLDTTAALDVLEARTHMVRALDTLVSARGQCRDYLLKFTDAVAGVCDGIAPPALGGGGGNEANQATTAQRPRVELEDAGTALRIAAVRALQSLLRGDVSALAGLWNSVHGAPGPTGLEPSPSILGLRSALAANLGPNMPIQLRLATCALITTLCPGGGSLAGVNTWDEAFDDSHGDQGDDDGGNDHFTAAAIATLRAVENLTDLYEQVSADDTYVVQFGGRDRDCCAAGLASVLEGSAVAAIHANQSGLRATLLERLDGVAIALRVRRTALARRKKEQARGGRGSGPGRQSVRSRRRPHSGGRNGNDRSGATLTVSTSDTALVAEIAQLSDELRRLLTLIRATTAGQTAAGDDAGPASAATDIDEADRRTCVLLHRHWAELAAASLHLLVLDTVATLATSSMSAQRAIAAPVEAKPGTRAGASAANSLLGRVVEAATGTGTDQSERQLAFRVLCALARVEESANELLKLHVPATCADMLGAAVGSRALGPVRAILRFFAALARHAGGQTHILMTRGTLASLLTLATAPWAARVRVDALQVVFRASFASPNKAHFLADVDGTIGRLGGVIRHAISTPGAIEAGRGGGDGDQRGGNGKASITDADVEAVALAAGSLWALIHGSQRARVAVREAAGETLREAEAVLFRTFRPYLSRDAAARRPLLLDWMRLAADPAPLSDAGAAALNGAMEALAVVVPALEGP